MQVEWSEELLERMAALTWRQRSALRRVVETVGEGGSIRSLLTGPDKVCTTRTYYRRKGGWNSQERWRAALALAQEEYDRQRLSESVTLAAERIRRASLTSVELAEAVVLLALRGSEEDESSALRTLARVMMEGEGQPGQVRAATAVLARGLQAALSILDRADIETAVKSAGGEETRWAGLLEELREVADEGPEGGGVRAAGVPSARDAVAGTREPGAGGVGGGGGAERKESVVRIGGTGPAAVV